VTKKQFFHKLNQTDVGRYEISVGEVYGITQGALFVVHPSHKETSSGTGLRVKPLKISLYKTLLDVPPAQAATMSKDAMVLQVRVGVKEPFPIYISDRRLDDIVGGVQYEMKKHGMRELAVVNDGSAKLGLDLELDNPNGQQLVVLRILDQSISRWGLNRMHDTISPSPPDTLYNVLSAAANFDWHLHRGSGRIGNSRVGVEFTKLQESSETIEKHFIGGRISNIKVDRWVPEGKNMIETGPELGGNVVFVDVLKEAVYGIKLTNKTDVPLYVSIFYFDSSDLSISK